jgi:3-oxoadipate enol-lactonase
VRSHIPRAESALLDAAHLSNIEQPREFTDAVLGFLSRTATS